MTQCQNLQLHCHALAHSGVPLQLSLQRSLPDMQHQACREQSPQVRRPGERQHAAAVHGSPVFAQDLLQHRKSAFGAHVTGMPPPTCSTTSSALPLGSAPVAPLDVPCSSSSSSRSSRAGSRGSFPSLISSSMLPGQIHHQSTIARIEPLSP